MQRAIKGRIETPAGRSKRDGAWITIHDPLTSDLQWLLDNHPESQILGIEIAVDFTPLDRDDKLETMQGLHGWLKTRLFPQRHPIMGQVTKRKYYEARTGQIVADRLQTRSENGTVYWTHPSAYEQVRLYIKKSDNGVTLNQTSSQRACVRIEATLFRGGCQNAGLHRVAELPLFADQMRRYLSRFLYVASGIRPKLKRTRTNNPEKARRAGDEADKERKRVADAWNRYGAAWAGRHGYNTLPDNRVNRLIGKALKGLRDDLMRLKLTAKVAEAPDYITLEKPVNSRVVGPRTPACIEALMSSLRQHQGSIDTKPQDREQEPSAECKDRAADEVLQMHDEENVCTPKN